MNQRFDDFFITPIILFICISVAYLFSLHRGSDSDTWVGLIFSNQELKGSSSLVSSRYLMFPKMFPNPFPARDFSIDWATCLSISEAVKVTFVVGSDDGARLFIDEEKILDDWKKHSFKENVLEREISPGVHLIRIEYFQGNGRSALTLKTKIGEDRLRYLGEKNTTKPTVVNGEFSCN